MKTKSKGNLFLSEKGVTFTPCTNKQAWIDACAPLYAKYTSCFQDFIKEIQSYK